MSHHLTDDEKQFVHSIRESAQLAVTIYEGTSEIQCQDISKRILGAIV